MGKEGGTRDRFRKFTKLKREDLMWKMKSLALIKGYIIVV